MTGVRNDRADCLQGDHRTNSQRKNRFERQIYRRMNIGTAKPTKEEMGGVPHYLMDICEPTESYSVSDYREAAEKLVAELAGKGRNVLFVGGTVLYLQS